MMAGSNTNNRGGYDNDGTITSRLQQHAQPQQQNSASSSVKLYCCGCKSRTATIIALVFLLLGGCLYTAVGIAGLNDLRQRAEQMAASHLRGPGSFVSFILPSRFSITGRCLSSDSSVTRLLTST